MEAEFKKSYSVSKYLGSVKRLISEKIPQVWVHGVITQIAQKGRVCYINMAEYEENDTKPVSTLSLIIYVDDLYLMNNRLKALAQPFELQTELKVSLLLVADFYVPLGRFQPRIMDIDPNYTLGEMAQTRAKVLERLQKEGLLNKNKNLEFPLIPLSIALITSKGSAAHKDFLKVLAQSPFAFEITSAYARMQGQDTESTVIQALKQVQDSPEVDVICIVRGGGSKTDLNYFDSEALCRAIANCPKPVLTGIGHEIDHSLADLVAWSDKITPTDCARFLVDSLFKVESHLLESASRLQLSMQDQLRQSRDSLSQTYKNLFKGITQNLQLQNERVMGRLQRIKSGPLRRVVAQEYQRLQTNGLGLKQGTRKIMEAESLKLDSQYLGLHQGSRKLIESIEIRLKPHYSNLIRTIPRRLLETKEQLALKARLLKASDPATPLKRGYSITRTIEGQVIGSAQQIKSGDIIRTQTASGSFNAKVID
jgi:exodeoxyribonuclease VII large subunit